MRHVCMVASWLLIGLRWKDLHDNGIAMRALISTTALVGLLAGAAYAQTPWKDAAENWHDAPPSHTLACRGPLELEVQMGASPAITLHYTRATKAAASGVDTGTCAWIDRGMTSAEPDCLQDDASDVAIRISPPMGHASGTAASTGPTNGAAATLRSDGSPESFEQIVRGQTGEAQVQAAPVMVFGSSVRAPYIRF